jgi:RecG-like helicase
MAPTEILAVQHYLSAKRILAPGGYKVELLISGLKPAEKAAARERIGSGEAQLVIGTHALIEEQVEFQRLGFVAIDEQHRFGVLQRKKLMDKAASHGHAPHVLVLTATPIPRTLSLTLYGDLDVSVLDGLPPGRTPIETRMTTESHLPGSGGGASGLRGLSSHRRIEAGTESGDGGIRTALENNFLDAQSGVVARTAFERREGRRNATVSAE